MSDDPPTTTLMTRAADGDKQAWDALVERYTPLVWSICRRHQLGSDQAGDVGQAVWLKLGKHLGDIHNPAALAGWLATTTRRECSRVRRAARPAQATGNATAAETIPDEHTGMAGQELMAAERNATLYEAFTRLPLCCQQLIALLIEDPPVPSAHITARLGIAVGSIGPRRGRCLDKLRSDPAITTLLDADAASTGASHLGGHRRPYDDQSMAMLTNAQPRQKSPADQASDP